MVLSFLIDWILAADSSKMKFVRLRKISSAIKTLILLMLACGYLELIFIQD